MKRFNLFLTGSPGHVGFEVGLVALALAAPLVAIMLPQPEGTNSWPILTLGLAYIGLFNAFLAAFRLRPSIGDRRRWLVHEFVQSILVIIPIWAGALIALIGVAVLNQATVAPLLDPVAFTFATPVFSLFAAIPATLAYPILRSIMLAIPILDRLRRTRLLWALTYAQLRAGLVLAILATIVTAAVNVNERFLPNPIPHNYTGAARFLITVLPEVTALLVLSSTAVLLIVPPVAFITYAVLRRTTRRLEALTAATSALRAGDLSARVIVGGEDEVARLQADFNSMAADLERAMQAVQDERDRVAGLLATQRELTAAVSHELRTPVATLRSYLDSSLAHWNGAPPLTLRQDLQVMAHETDRLQRLIEDLFTVSRAEIGRLSLRIDATDVESLLRQCAEAAATPAWERGRVEVLAEVQPKLPHAQADSGRLEQVVRNLIANAVRHTPPGGLVLLTAEQAGHAIVIQVKDSGDGIAPDELPRIWERFYRTDRARDRDQGGAGLGLALVKELTEAMGGRVSVESVVGAGSCFTLRLPIFHATTYKA